MGKTFNSAQRAARRGKKRQDRRKKARQHIEEYREMKNAPRARALQIYEQVENRERTNKRKHHTRKVSHERKAQQNTPDHSPRPA